MSIVIDYKISGVGYPLLSSKVEILNLKSAFLYYFHMESKYVKHWKMVQWVIYNGIRNIKLDKSVGILIL